MPLIMHHIALCTPCIALFNCGHLLHIRINHAELESEFQAEQVRWVFGGPQVLSGEDANILVIKASTVHLTNALVFYFERFTLCLFECALSL
jgi:hypothetical protein